MYYGNSTMGFDADEPAPTLILRCGFCLRDLDFYGDVDDDGLIDGAYQLGAYDIVRCACGANYGEDDPLEIVPDPEFRQPTGAFDPFTDLYDVAAYWAEYRRERD